MQKTIDLSMQVRSASFVPETVNVEARTVEVVWSTGASVRRREWNTGRSYEEILSMDPAHVRMDRLNSGAPLLDSHNRSGIGTILGVVEKGWIVKAKGGFEGRALVRFSSRDDVKTIFNDVQEGILRNISVGYSVMKYEITEGPIPVWRAVDWSPMELSVVPVGADPGAGFRTAEQQTSPCELEMRKGSTMPNEQTTEPKPPVDDTVTRSSATTTAPDPVEMKREPTAPTAPTAPQPDADAFTRDDAQVMVRQALEMERKRSATIYDTQTKLGVDRAVADKMVTEGTSIEEARGLMIDEAAKRSATMTIRGGGVVTAGEMDEKTTRNAAVENALLHRFDSSAHKLTDAAREWRGMTLIEMAREFTSLEGRRSSRGESRHELATRALHSGSDFPNILANVANKTLRGAYETAPRTFLPFRRWIKLHKMRPWPTGPWRSQSRTFGVQNCMADLLPRRIFSSCSPLSRKSMMRIETMRAMMIYQKIQQTNYACHQIRMRAIHACHPTS